MSSFKSFLSRNAGTLALLLVLTASLSLNVVLAARLKGRSAPPPIAGIQVNSTMPVPLQVQDKDGKPTLLTFADDPRPTVLCVLSPHCGWCKKNEANVQALSAGAGTHFRFVGLSVSGSGLPEYIASHTSFPIYLVDSEKLRKELRLDGTPQTAVVGRDGKVLKSWQGAYTEDTQKEIEAYFNIRLPGLQQVASSTGAAH